MALLVSERKNVLQLICRREKYLSISGDYTYALVLVVKKRNKGHSNGGQGRKNAWSSLEGQMPQPRWSMVAKIPSVVSGRKNTLATVVNDRKDTLAMVVRGRMNTHPSTSDQ